jgi:hypothetical protein
MEDVFYYQILNFLNDDIIIKSFYCLSKHESIKKRRKQIIKKISNDKLYDRLYGFERSILNWNDFLENSNDYTEFLKDVIEVLLDEISLERSHSYFINKRFLKKDKYITTDTIYYHNNMNNMLNRFLTNNQQFIKTNVLVCATYRLPCLQTSVLTKFFPHAKALIY